MSRKKKEYEVENQLIDHLVEMGYKRVKLKNYSEVVDNFRKEFVKVNREKLIEAKGEAVLSDKEFERVMLRLEGHSIYESAKILRETYDLDLDNGKHVYVRFLTDDASQNTYQVAHQITMDKDHKEDVEYKNRYDVTLFINGLPLVQIELKAAGIEINQAINQINRYRRFSFKGLFKYIQIFVVSNGAQTKYFANANETAPNGSKQDILKSLVFYWTDEKNERINNLIEFTDSFLNKFHITQMLNEYFVVKESEPVLMVLRPYQFYAVRNALDRITGSHKSGYCFHCTGSGKTLTSFELASLLRKNRQIEKVFFLIDRKDLDDQTVDEYNSFEKGSVDATSNTRQLVKDLKNSSKDLIVTTIQKLSRALNSERNKELFESFKDKRCVFIIDECHRSQFGKMHADIKRTFQNADFIGFTGTPIFKENRTPGKPTTADMFATNTDKMNPCIHRYMIKEAIADGNVLRFSVEFMKSATSQKLKAMGLDENRLNDPEYLKEKNINAEEVFHSDEWIEGNAEDIIKHLDKHIRPMGKDKYTALFAVDSIPTLRRYYKALKKYNDKGYKIAAIYTYDANSEADGDDQKLPVEGLDEIMKDYNEMFGTSYDPSTFDAYRKDVSERMKQNKEPELDLLICVDMFLTGWDSKPTNTLILDKNLSWHGLLQAYSRTNRVDKPTKNFGQIVTYRNIKKAQDDALRLFSGDGNPDDFLMESYEYYVSQYRKSVDELREVAENSDTAGKLQSEDDQAAYVKAFRKLAGTLATLKTFSKFQWEDLDLFMDEAEYEDYHSHYFDYYYERTHLEKEKQSILADLDFCVELLRTDKINVVYILNLLKDLNQKDEEAKREGIDLILREIERSDNEKVRLKTDILKAFIEERFFDLKPDSDVVALYYEFEQEKKEKRITEFAEETGLPLELVDQIVTTYMIDPKSSDMDSIRQKLQPLHLGFKKKVALKKRLKDFARNIFNVFTAEGA